MECIISKDYRKFLVDNQIELSDWEKATLIYNHKLASRREKWAALREIKESTSNKVLRKQIEERLEQDICFYEIFKKKQEGTYYKLYLFSGDRYIEEGVYQTFFDVYEDGIKEKEPFKIEKDSFLCVGETEIAKGILGSVDYDADGNIGNHFWLYDSGEDKTLSECDKNRFEGRYTDLPMCFRQGDIVKIVGTEKYGIIYGITNEADEERHCGFGRASREYCDFQLAVDLFYDDKKYLSVFSHEHVPPTEIEFAEFEEGDTRKGFLEYMKKTMYHNSLWNGTGRETRRIKEVLSKLETVWNQYPDFRLGQLLLNVCGSCNLFAMEDEKLMERLEKNIFPIGD